MRRWAIPIGMLLLLGCAPSARPPGIPAPFSPVLNLKQFMEWVVDPAADVIWDSVKTISTQAGTKEIAPQNDEQWDAVRNAAATLTESGNLLMIEGRARDRAEWMSAARALVATAEKAIKAAEAKNKDAVFDIGGEIYVACRSCHDRYAKHLTAAVPPDAPRIAPAAAPR